MDVYSCHFLPDHVQFTLIHGPNIPGSYAILFLIALDFTFITRHIHNGVEQLVVVLHSSPVAYWTPSNLGDSSPSIISFSLFTLFMGFSQQEDCSGLPFSPSVDHIVSELFTMTHPSWVALQGIAHSFTELCKPLQHNKSVIHERRYSIYRVILNDQI